MKSKKQATDSARRDPLRGMSPHQRAALIVLANAGPAGIDRAAVERLRPLRQETFQALRVRSLAKYVSPPADHPGDWAFVLEPDPDGGASALALEALRRAQRGEEDQQALVLLRNVGVLSSVTP